MGRRFLYIVAGKGEPVVLIHGLTASAQKNWTQPGITAILAKDYQVIAMDGKKGHGNSGQTDHRGRPTEKNWWKMLSDCWTI